MASGKQPFAGKSAADVMSAVLREDPPELDSTPPSGARPRLSVAASRKTPCAASSPPPTSPSRCGRSAISQARRQGSQGRRAASEAQISLRGDRTGCRVPGIRRRTLPRQAIRSRPSRVPAADLPRRATSRRRASRPTIRASYMPRTGTARSHRSSSGRPAVRRRGPSTSAARNCCRSPPKAISRF